MSLMKRLMAKQLEKARPVAPAKARVVDGVKPVPWLEPPVFLSELRAAEAPKAEAPPVRTVGTCKAINAETGRQCALPDGHLEFHRHGRTSFVHVAQPGQTHFARRDALDQAATARGFNPLSNPSIQGEG
jgi:hypothetical protein